MKIHVLSPGFTNPNSAAFLFPLYVFRQALADSGITLRFFTRPDTARGDCDRVLIDAKALAQDWNQGRGADILGALRACAPVIWCDQSDSTGTFLGQVLPHVDRYLKAQLLGNTDDYRRSYYGDRIYTDYYHKKYGPTDDLHYHYTPLQNAADARKISLSWNSGLMHYGAARPWLMKLWERLPFQPFRRFAAPIAPAARPRDVPLACRMGIGYPRATVRYQRERLKEILARYIPTDKLSHRRYLQELARAKISVSPFGYGEITLKDFETFLAGALLLKPDMSHMTTWPDFYEKDVTYAAHGWDLEDVESVIEDLLENEDKRQAIAAAGQQRYLDYTAGPDAAARFVAHFKSVIGA